MNNATTGFNQAKCQQYAPFAAHLERLHFKSIYWVLFILVLLMLFVSSWYWTKCNEAVDKYTANSIGHRRHMRRCLIVCFFCLFTAIVANVMEIYALMALQFCEGEDLMSLYWSTWTTLQLTSNIGIVGIFLAVIHSYRGRKHPPWSLALGTPITVISGIAHLMHSAIKRRVERRKVEKDTLSMRATTTQNTLVDDNQATDSDKEDKLDRVVGFGHDGGPILLLEEMPTFLPSCATILGKNSEGKFIVVYNPDSARSEFRYARSEAPEPRRDTAGSDKEAEIKECDPGDTRV